ncbi:hypothetical protein DFH09DRAFT_948439 [Mycena vulgaris]|nr:hypothetical protein DFH09DRAFT_948439 [Mycena vulgaris]
MPSTVLKTLGGSINYWHNQETFTPSLFHMGSDFCSAPTSVDSERAFSVGRRKLGLMQHNTSDQTFRSSMAVGSWDGAHPSPISRPQLKFCSRRWSVVGVPPLRID